jgi:hypothetical protein
MPGPWIQTAQLIARASARVGRDLTFTASGAANVQDLAEEALRIAYGQIVSALSNRGWTVADMDRWDFREDYLRTLSLYWLLTSLSIDGYDQQRLAGYNILSELQKSSFTLIVNGTPLAPSQGDQPNDGGDVAPNIPGGEIYGNSSVAVGALSQRNWPIRKDFRW